jgi:hypothetical protein
VSPWKEQWVADRTLELDSTRTSSPVAPGTDGCNSIDEVEYGRRLRSEWLLSNPWDKEGKSKCMPRISSSFGRAL